LEKSSTLLKFTPFLDEDGILRVGGRVGRADLPYDAKHPRLLRSHGPLGLMVARYYHQRAHHAGTDHVLALMRQDYWILHGRELVRKVARDCMFCKKERLHTTTQLMAELPPQRMHPGPPFYHTSVDYFGPIDVNISRNRSDKRYGALFTCMTTRAVHIEVAPSLSTSDFLNVLRVFTNLRGTPKTIYSDQGRNFVGAEKEIAPRLEKLSEDPEFASQMVQRGIKWVFQPPNAPHFGGVHESLVKSAKRAMYRVLDRSQQRRLPTDWELKSLMAEVTGFLNSRPLTYVSNDPSDVQALTPNHFLHGRAQVDKPPGVSVEERALGLKDHYKFVQRLAGEVWEEWIRHYMPTLMARHKWQHLQRNLKVGDVVLLVDQNQPRNRWLMGRIGDVIKGRDGLVRRVVVKTNHGEYERPITRCVLLQEDDGNATTG